MKKLISVAIDGPAGAGKSTVAKGVAKELGYIYVDTGALYRTIALHLIENHVSESDKDTICKNLKNIRITFSVEDGRQMIRLFGNDVSEKIRTPEISMMASKIAAIGEVRDFLMDLQRDVAQHHSVVMDGRDIGTVVLPDADVKIFLTASCEERAKRRFDELQLKNDPTTYEEVLRQVKERDHNDANRAIAPLKKADDAVLIDSSNMSADQVIQEIVNTVQGAIIK